MAKQAALSVFSRVARLTVLCCAIIVMVGALTSVNAQGALAKITSGNADKLKMLATLTGHTGNVLSLAFSPDGNTLASGGVDTTIRLWNVQNPTSAQPGAVLQGHSKQVAIVAFSTDGKTLISGGYDYTLHFWDVASAKQTAIQDQPGPMIDAMINSFSPDMSVLLYGASGAVGLWDVKKGAAVPLDAVTSTSQVWGWAAFAPDGHSFYLADVASNKLYQIPVAGGDSKVVLTGPDGANYDGPLALSPDGNTLAVATSNNESIHLFDVKSGKVQVLATGDNNDQNILVFSPDNSLLIASGADSSRLWDVKTGKQVATLPDKQILATAFNPAGTLLALAIPELSSTVPTKIELWGVPAQ